MRVLFKLFVVLIAAFGVFAVVHFRPRFLFPARAANGNSASQALSISNAQSQEQVNQTSNPAPPAGFYVGEGDQRVFVSHTSNDPVVRALLESVMEGNIDPKTRGKQIFLKLCAICHQRDGEGKDNLAPPLVGSEWALTPKGGRMVRIVLNGLTGPVVVKGKTWNLTMPPWRDNLSDEQVALVLTYVRSELGENSAGPITQEVVASLRRDPHVKPETPEELMQVSNP